MQTRGVEGRAIQFNRRRFLGVAAVAVGAKMSGAAPVPSSDLPDAIRNLRPMTGGIKPISEDERRARALLGQGNCLSFEFLDATPPRRHSNLRQTRASHVAREKDARMAKIAPQRGYVQGLRKRPRVRLVLRRQVGMCSSPLEVLTNRIERLESIKASFIFYQCCPVQAPGICRPFHPVFKLFAHFFPC